MNALTGVFHGAWSVVSGLGMIGYGLVALAFSIVTTVMSVAWAIVSGFVSIVWTVGVGILLPLVAASLVLRSANRHGWTRMHAFVMLVLVGTVFDSFFSAALRAVVLIALYQAFKMLKPAMWGVVNNRAAAFWDTCCQAATPALAQAATRAQQAVQQARQATRTAAAAAMPSAPPAPQSSAHPVMRAAPATRPEKPPQCRVDSDECPICLDAMIEKTYLPCGHCFHKSCVTQWITYDASCPVCRRSHTLTPAQ